MLHAGRKKLKRRAAREDSNSESNGGTDPGNQLVQYHGGASMDASDFINGLMALDDSGDSAELRHNQTNLVEVHFKVPCLLGC